MGDLSQHFSRSEFACKCCGLSVPHPALVLALENLRIAVAVPVTISSGTRCAARNAAVGGSSRSYHLPIHGIDKTRSLAADIRARGLTAVQLLEVARETGSFGGIGLYRNVDPRAEFVHVDVRGVVARWAMIGGREAPLAIALAWQSPGAGEVAT